MPPKKKVYKPRKTKSRREEAPPPAPSADGTQDESPVLAAEGGTDAEAQPVLAAEGSTDAEAQPALAAEGGQDREAPPAPVAEAEGNPHDDAADPPADEEANEVEEEDAAPARPSGGKGKAGAKGKGKQLARSDFTLPPDQEEDLVEWMRENEGVWRRGHRLYKGRRTVWAVKAQQCCTTLEHLEGWWKSIKDWYVRLSKKKSGQATKKLTDREKWIMDRISFYAPQLKVSEAQSEPMTQLACHASRPDLPPLESEEEDEHPTPTEGTSQGDTGDLQEIEAAATNKGQKRKRQEKQGEKLGDEQFQQLMNQLLTRMDANTALVTQLIQPKLPVGDREPFLEYIAQTLRPLSQETYEYAKTKIWTFLQTLPRYEVTRPAQSQSAPPHPPQQFYQPQPQPQAAHQYHQMQPQFHQQSARDDSFTRLLSSDSFDFLSGPGTITTTSFQSGPGLQVPGTSTTASTSEGARLYQNLQSARDCERDDLV